MPRTANLATENNFFIYFVNLNMCNTLLDLWVIIIISVNHAMTTIATGGFSSNSQSIGGYNNFSLEYVCIIFMILSSLPFVLYLKTFRGKTSALIKDEQVTGFLNFIFSNYFDYGFLVCSK